MKTIILALFDSAGYRTDTVISGVHFQTKADMQRYLDKGYVAISEDDLNYYIGNNGEGGNGTGYIRDQKTGRPISAPKKEQNKEQKLEIIRDKYNTELNELKNALMAATLAGDNATIKDIKADYAELMAEYEKEIEEVAG